MTSKSKTAFIASVTGGSLLLAGWRTVVIIKNIEKIRENDNAYYLKDSAAVNVFTAAAVVFAAAVIILSLFFGKKDACEHNDDHIASAVASLICAFTLVFQFGVTAVMFLNGGNDLRALMAEGQYFVFVITMLIPMAALASGLLYFLRFGIRSGKQRPSAPESVALAALAPTFYCALRLLNDFIKTNSAPMESSGAYHILSLCFLMIFFLTDGKSSFRPVRFSLYVPLGSIAAMLLLVYSVPNLILYGTGLLDLDFSSSLLGSVADLTIAAYVLSRVASCGKKRGADTEENAAADAE